MPALIKDRLKATRQGTGKNKRLQIAPEEGVSAFELSRFVADIEVGLWYSGRVAFGTKAAVLRALADRYPNCWASVADIAKKAKCGTTQAKLALRELELEDNLISEIIPNGRKPKQGGASWTVQYRINVEGLTRLLELQPLIKKIVGNPTDNPTDNPTGGGNNPTEPVALPDGTRLVTPAFRCWCSQNQNRNFKNALSEKFRVW